MPIHSGTDKDGSFYQWGTTGKKYHFKPNDKKSRQNALCKAKAQQTAIYSSGWKGDNNMANKMKLIKVKKSDANVQKIVKPVEEARQLLLSATSQLSVFIGRTKMISGVHEIDEAEDYIKDLENTLESFNKNLSKAKAALKEAGK